MSSASSATIQHGIAKALRREDLSAAEMADVIGVIMDGGATPAQIGGFLVALRAKGEAVDELVGAATAMRARAAPLLCHATRAVDTCGTGGDGTCTVNISTLAALILAGSGVTVAKHGNRALSSRCGSADVLEALGVVVDAEPAVVARCLAVAGIGFAFAPKFHAATRHAGGPRRELGTRTIFNLLGPLTNPARVAHQVVGVFDRAWCEPMARALAALGVRRAAVVHGAGGPDGPTGIDELAVRGDTFVALAWDGAVTTLTLAPKDFGLDDADPAALAGDDAAFNAGVLRRALAGERVPAVHEAAVMTAALALELVDGGAAFARDQLPVRAATAARALANGDAAGALERLARTSREAAP